MNTKQSLVVIICNILDRITRWLDCDRAQPTLRGVFMYKVKADQADVPYSIVVEGTDSEGNPVDASNGVTWNTIESSNTNGVDIVPDDDNHPETGTIKIGGPNSDGTPSVATLTLTGTVNKTGEAIVAQSSFVVGAGDLSKITVAKMKFDGLVEEPDVPEAEPDTEEEEDTDEEEG